MTAPDTNTILLSLITAIGWVGAWLHGRRNGARRAIIQNDRINKMWADYKQKHGILENGGES